MNTYERKRKEALAEIKQLLLNRKSTLVALRVEQGETGKWGIVTKCKSCNRIKRMPACYWRGYDCGCTRAERIRKSQRHTDTEMNAIFKRTNVKPLEDYTNLNTPMKVKCCKCNHTWVAWPVNLKGGHSCTYCAQDRLRKECFAKHGVYSYMVTPKAIQNRKRTMIKRYGKEHALQNKELFDKMQISSSRRKEYLLGKRKVQVQGYEPQGLNFILAKGVKPKDIEAGVGNPKIPTVDYWYKGMWRVYYPDIWLAKQNRLFEVKNRDNYRRDHKRNMLKEKACIEAGYKFTWLVMSKSGERLDHRNL